MSLISLFLISFLAATILPAQSEAVLVGIALQKEYSLPLLLLVASTGNVLGACVNWLLGRYLLRFQDKKWFPVNGRQLEKGSVFYQRWGAWTLLFSWLPIIGDAFTIIAGVLHMRFMLFLVLVSLGKTARYAVILYAIDYSAR